jgi:hypothetical protein
VVSEPRWDLHGILVGAASRLVLAIYRRFFELLPSVELDVGSRLAAYNREPPLGSRIEPALQPFVDKIREETEARLFDRSLLSERLERFPEARAGILAMGRPLLAELADAVETLARLDYPFSLGELGVPAEAAMLAVRNVRLLRYRYSCFDLAWELGLADELQRSAEAYIRG